MFKFILKTVLEALILEGRGPSEMQFYKILANVTSSFFLTYSMFFVLQGEPYMWTLLVVWSLAVLLGIFFILPATLFLIQYGLGWETSRYYASRKKWWSRLDHIHKPIEIAGNEMVYDAEKDAYHIGFLMSRGIVEDLSELADDYDTDLGGVVDQSLGLFMLQNEARTLNTEHLLIATHNQSLTEQSNAQKEPT